jgi:hypothetical protein
VKKITTEHCLFLLLMLSVAGVLVWGGCGVKAPPVAPEQPPLPTITDLKAAYGNGRVLLGWHHPGGESPAVGYHVLKSQRSVSQPECPGCPMIFQRIGTEKLQRTLRTQRHALEFEAVAQAGYLYHFKVVPIVSSGAQGPDSNVVEIEAK